MSEGDSSDLGAPTALKEDHSSIQQQQGEGDGIGTGTGTGKSFHHGINGGGNDDDHSSSDDEEVDTITSLSLFRRGSDGFGVGGRIIPVRKRPAAKSLIRRTHHRRARIRQQRQQLSGQQEIQNEGDLFSIKITATTTSETTATNTTSTTKSSPVKKNPKTTTTTGVNGSSSSSTQRRKPTRGGPAVPDWEGRPDEPLEGGWPDGWIKRIYLRKGGATAGQKDRYWFSPKNFKLRSMVEVKKFMKALQQYNGDEKLASKSYKKIQL